jgi:NAD(P)-dependent dehydrogenase (short-subunit alcohol dehydrogenase family)
MPVFVVHRDRRASMPGISKAFQEIRQSGGRLESLNADALSEVGMQMIVQRLRELIEPDGKVAVLVHSITQGNLKKLAAEGSGSGETLLSEEDFAQTLHAMGSSLSLWTTRLLRDKLLAPDTRVLGITSEGGEKASPYYAAVGAAKAVLQSLCRSMALELAPFGIRTNLVSAGVTDTPGIRSIPGHEEMMLHAIHRNPFGRLTQPEDVANVIWLLTLPESAWINGAIIRVDGGEQIVGWQ